MISHGGSLLHVDYESSEHQHSDAVDCVNIIMDLLCTKKKVLGDAEDCHFVDNEPYVGEVYGMLRDLSVGGIPAPTRFLMINGYYGSLYFADRYRYLYLQPTHTMGAGIQVKLFETKLRRDSSTNTSGFGPIQYCLSKKWCVENQGLDLLRFLLRFFKQDINGFVPLPALQIAYLSGGYVASSLAVYKSLYDHDARLLVCEEGGERGQRGDGAEHDAEYEGERAFLLGTSKRLSNMVIVQEFAVQQVLHAILTSILNCGLNMPLKEAVIAVVTQQLDRDATDIDKSTGFVSPVMTACVYKSAFIRLMDEYEEHEEGLCVEIAHAMNSLQGRMRGLFYVPDALANLVSDEEPAADTSTSRKLKYGRYTNWLVRLEIDNVARIGELRERINAVNLYLRLVHKSAQGTEHVVAEQ